MTVRIAWIAFLVLVLALANGAAAAPPPKRTLENAKGHFKAGEDHFAAGEYGPAVIEYKAAFELVPRPLLLYNIAQAYRLDGNTSAAVDYYQRYLAADPNGKVAQDAAEYVKSLTEAIEAERKAPSLDKGAEPVPPPSPVPATGTPEPALPSGAVRSEGGGSSSRGMKIAGVTSMAAGAAGLGVGVFFGLRARSLASDVEKSYVPSKVSDGEAANRNMFIAFGIGGAAIATGAILLYVATRSDARSEPRAVVFPVLSPSTVGLAAQSRF